MGDLDLSFQRLAYASVWPLLIGLYFVYDGFRESTAPDAGPRQRAVGSYLPLLIPMTVLIGSSKAPWYVAAIPLLIVIPILAILSVLRVSLRDILLHKNLATRVIVWALLFLGFCACTERAGSIAASAHLDRKSGAKTPPLYDILFAQDSGIKMGSPVSLALQTGSFLILVEHAEAKPIVSRVPAASVTLLRLVDHNPTSEADSTDSAEETEPSPN